MNTYLIASETIYKINNKLKELTDNIQNIVTFDLLDNTMDEVLEEASYFSMFNDKKCVVVKNAFIFGTNKNSENKNAQSYSEKLLKYLENENENTRLIFIWNNKCDSKKKIYKIINDAKNAFIYTTTTKTEMKNELLKIVTDNGYKIEDKSLWHILNSTLGNFDLSLKELEKIMIYYSKPGQIIYQDVLNLTAKNIEDNNFKLVGSIVAKDLDNSLKYLSDFKILKGEPSVILSLLYREFKLMLSVITYENMNMSYQEILKNLNLQDWQLQKIKDNIRYYQTKEIKKEIMKLAQIDYQYKVGLVNRDLVLINYIIDLCC